MKQQHLPLTFVDHVSNPLITPPFPEFLIADPTFLPPDQSPDGKWHLFAHGILLGIHHFRSDDGVAWRRVGRLFWGMRPFVMKEGDGYLMFFERIVSLKKSVIAMARSGDLVHWSRPVVILEPSLEWEGTTARTNGNPSVVRCDDGWRLYYSAGLSWLKDCGFPEPRHIGVAFADRPEGPWRKHPQPILSPSPDVPHRNHGAGAIKVVRDGTGFLGFNNGIFIDAEGRSRSDIRLLLSDDGIAWREAADRPLVAPEGTGWKRALVYALDARCVDGTWWMYYNARSGWRFGVERIGLATCTPGAVEG
jgi:predicted GH43/DUF377 family glycosyl hydrolase